MNFEIGRYYEHTTGSRLFIAGCISSCVYGLCLIGENEFGEFSAIGNDEDCAINYVEITKEQFMSPSKRLRNLMKHIVYSLSRVEQKEMLQDGRFEDSVIEIMKNSLKNSRVINNKAELDYYKDKCADDHKQDERDFFQAQRRCRETLFECAKNLADKDFETSKK